MKILIIEDNEKLLKDIQKELSKSFEVDITQDGEEGLYAIKQNIHDLIILDLMIPSISGLDLLSKIRKEGIKTPTIILTAKEGINSKIEAFNIGANDYLTKPFYMEELVARVFAVLRSTGKIEDINIIKFNDLKLDMSGKVVFIKDEIIDLQNKQYMLLEYLMINKGSILLKDQILDRIWGVESSITTDIVEVHISNLRKKLSVYGYDKYIKTKRKVGYMFDDK